MFVGRACSLIFAIAALALMVILLFFPFFESKWKTADADPSGGISPIMKGEITFWEFREWPLVGGQPGEEVKHTLRTEYFTCDDGKMRIQAVEGVAIIASALCFLNFLMSVFLFCFPTILRLPLTLYFLLAALASAVVLILMMWWYVSPWCPEQGALKADTLYKWEYGLGWKLVIASCGSSLIGCIMAAISC
ncbi:uncharacterized protein TM35_000152290 [Trypanosoma theileri]|uniref:Amastin n=1 Tax=Trypanosoma theileri TaxID=67003 RepID=A0A1X0NW81_9TRYP|nr:uncharacterized protein TM35_000152290 [Trypanosoma theileri]ORC88798.1 hypothetical protein TM35_000152290 [Trypanosoma theileri]